MACRQTGQTALVEAGDKPMKVWVYGHYPRFALGLVHFRFRLDSLINRSRIFRLVECPIGRIFSGLPEMIMSGGELARYYAL